VAFRCGLRAAVGDGATAVPVNRSSTLTPLAAGSQRGGHLSFGAVDDVVDWMQRPPSLLHHLRRGRSLHRPHGVHRAPDAARHQQPRQEPQVSSNLLQHSPGRRVSRPECSHPIGAGLGHPHLAALRQGVSEARTRTGGSAHGGRPLRCDDGPSRASIWHNLAFWQSRIEHPR
jgi:hypothetical protein